MGLDDKVVRSAEGEGIEEEWGEDGVEQEILADNTDDSIAVKGGEGGVCFEAGRVE